MDKQTIEADKLIAEFMDAIIEGNRYWINGLPYFDGGLKYHTSWDWLMPCIKKFNDMVKMEEIEHDMQSSALDDLMQIAVLRCNIADAHNYLSQLITWYNQLNK